MTSVQKIIKYLAIAFAIFLIVTIVSSILTGLFVLSGILGLKKHIKQQNNTSEMVLTSFESNMLERLIIDVDFTNLVIKNGNSLKVETDNENIKFNNDNKKLEIKEKGNNWFTKNYKGNLIVYIPENIEFKKIDISAGFGKIEIDNLVAKDISLELGAGETQIKEINISNKCKIEGGAGRVDIESGIINDIDLDIGVGETNITASLIGRSDINAGIGNLNIELIGNKEDYKIKTNKGIGTIKIEGNNMLDGQVYGYGENIIGVDGGIGNIAVKFK